MTINRDQLRQIINNTLTQINKLNDTKGREYAGDDDALANFHNRAEQMGITPMQVWGIFYGKHSDAIYAYIRNGKVLSEPIEGRIDDAILYLILLKGLVLEHEHPLIVVKGDTEKEAYDKAVKVTATHYQSLVREVGWCNRCDKPITAPADLDIRNGRKYHRACDSNLGDED